VLTGVLEFKSFDFVVFKVWVVVIVFVMSGRREEQKEARQKKTEETHLDVGELAGSGA
jgi:hypothetical protein